MRTQTIMVADSTLISVGIIGTNAVISGFPGGQIAENKSDIALTGLPTRSFVWSGSATAVFLYLTGITSDTLWFYQATGAPVVVSISMSN